MDYIYLLEEKANYINDTSHIFILYLLCYNINTDCKYPFLQFMMDKIPFCDNLVKEELTLPSVIIKNEDCDISFVVLDVLKKMYNGSSNGIEYKGVVEYNKVYYALISMTELSMTGLSMHRNSPCWFILPSEIIGGKNVCNIPINDAVVSLFVDNPEISLLTNSKTHAYYILPDSVYTIGDIKSVEFNSIFGNQKTKPYNSCDEYYFFYRSFKDILKIKKINEIERRYKHIGINRYALFVEGDLYLEENSECKLTNEIIKTEYNEVCIIICYLKEHDITPDMLVKSADYSCCLSYHSKINEFENI